MKRFFFWGMALVLLLSGCEKENQYERQAEKYAGNYAGVATLTHNEENISTDSTVTLRFTQSAQTPQDLVLQSAFTLEHEADNRYYAETGILTDSLRTALFAVSGVPDAYFENSIESATIEARFYSNSVAVKVLFSDANGIAGNATFTGSK